MKLCVIVCLQVVLAGGLSRSVSQKLDPEVLLEGYNLCNKEFETISYDLESDSQSRRRRLVYTVKHCARGDSKQWIGHRTLNMYNEDGTTRPARRERVADTYDGTRLVHLFRDHSEHPPMASLYGTSDGLLPKICQGWAQDTTFGGPLVGKVFGSDYHSVYDLLKGASNVTLHDTATKILDYDAYLLEANTRYGVVRAWISPDLDYNCMKWEINKEPNQFFRDGKFTNNWFTKWTAVYDAEKVERIDGRYITTQAKFKCTVTDETDDDTQLSDFTQHYKLTNIDFDPDYEDMGAFKIQLPEGTVVMDRTVPGVKYQWIGGRLQPLIDDLVIDALDSAVDELLENRRTVPEKQVEKLEGGAPVKQAVEVGSNRLSDRVIVKIENDEKNGSWTNTKKNACYMIGAFLILVIGFFVYRHSRKEGNNEK